MSCFYRYTNVLGWVLVGFGFSYTVCIPRRCYGYIRLYMVIYDPGL